MGSGRPQAAGHPVGAYGESERELTGKNQQKPGRALPFPVLCMKATQRQIAKLEFVKSNQSVWQLSHKFLLLCLSAYLAELP